MKLSPKWLGVLCGIASAAIWGVQSVVSRHAMLSGMTPADVTLLRFLTAAALLTPWALARMRPFPVGRLGWPRAWVIALMIGPLYSLLLVGGVYFAPALHSSIIAPGLIPIVTAALLFAVAGERPGRFRLAGLGIVVTGIAIFARDAFAMTPMRADAWIGDLIFVAVATIWSSFSLLARRWGADSAEITAACSILSVPLLAVVVLVMPLRITEASAGEILLQAVYQGILVSVVALYLYARSIALLGAGRAALFLPLVPLATAMAGALFLAEYPTPLELLGMAVVVAGMLIAFRAPSKG